ncbi:hypothetical protein GH714_011350 [Hevea brasiliensis]|uniref:Alpha-D-phosphohexomutase alpha/beta/alpha domain-containing protein n=1 Tax=Hevea brasiliensis TaxID=3981 RepID=A0A6A6LR62_HEVBR|nr:hypothetical protein GH714_011350 [Hevea brasiliensis]
MVSIINDIEDKEDVAFNKENGKSADVEDFSRSSKGNQKIQGSFDEMQESDEEIMEENEVFDLDEIVIEKPPSVELNFHNFDELVEQGCANVMYMENFLLINKDEGAISKAFPSKKLFSSSKFTFYYYDALHGVVGAYAKHIFVEELGAQENSLLICVSKEDFGGGHPDSNFTYARELAASMGLIKSSPQVEPTKCGITVDGNANRDMILSKRFFVIPSDSVAIIATNAYEVIKKNTGDDTSSFTYEAIFGED